MANTQPDSQESPDTPPRVSKDTTLPPGTSLGRYVLADAIALGGQGVVYAAQDPILDRKVALKLVRVRDAGGPSEDQRARLVREAQLLARLSALGASNVVQVLDVGRFDDQVFLAMEFMGGGTLMAWLEQPHAQAEVLARLRETARGLSAAHEANIVHRDFKPENVLLDANGVAHVTDFGLARALDGTSIVGGGTLAWMSPEQRARQEITPASDQYAWCLVAYRALTGRMPFEENDPPSKPLVFPSTVPPHVRAVLMRGLKERPDERYPSMKALLAEFDRDASVSRQRWLLGGLAVAALATLVVLVSRETPAERTERECVESIDTALSATWGAPRLDAMKQAFELNAGAEGVAIFDKAWKQLEPQTKSWAGASKKLCRSTEPSPARQTTENCLQTQGKVLESLAEVFASADVQVVENALSVITLEVTPAESCVAVNRLPAKTPDEVGEPDVELSLPLAYARVLRAAGRYTEGMRVAQTVAADANAADALKVEAEARVLTGELAVELHRHDAETILRQAIRVAEQGSADVARARGWIALIGWYAERNRIEEAHAAAAFADDISQRLGRLDLLEALRLIQVGQLATHEGLLDDARDAFERSLSLRRKHLPPAHPLVLRSLTQYALSLPQKEGLPRLLDVLQTRIVTLGPNHPETATAENVVADMMFNANACEGALLHASRAARSRERMPKPDLGQLGRDYVLMARAQACLGDLSDAVDTIKKGTELMKEGGVPSRELEEALHLQLEWMIHLGVAEAELNKVREDIKQTNE